MDGAIKLYLTCPVIDCGEDFFFIVKEEESLYRCRTCATVFHLREKALKIVDQSQPGYTDKEVRELIIEKQYMDYLIEVDIPYVEN